MEGPDRAGYFRGRELSRLLILAAITIVGWGVLYYYATRTAEAPEPAFVTSGKPPEIVPDKSAEFETVTDKTVVGFRDMAAYVKLLSRARESSPAGLKSEARRDVFYAHLWDFPKEFRGVPVHVSGTALQSLYYPSESSKSGWIYEVWISEPELRKNPFVCVGEEVPKGFPIGRDLSEQVTFDGYFLKLMRYEAGDVPRAAPMLIGRMSWKPHADDSGAASKRTTYWLVGGLSLMFVFSLVRWGLALRRAFLPKKASRPFERPNDEIAPGELAAFLGESSGEPEIHVGH